MSSPELSSGTPKPADLFEELWRQLGECHQTSLRELEAKVNKLKKDRCLDAQRLEVFFNRNQQLKEQNKTLQDAVSLLEERLRAGECDRCAILEENLKNNQDQNLRLVAKLKTERSSLEDENRKLRTELQKLKLSRSELKRTSSPEPEEGIIPDSPVLPSSLPVANKLKKRKNGDTTKYVRYAEMPLPQANNSLFKELSKELEDATKNPGRAEVLVPNTCELDIPQISNDVNLNAEEAIAETCAFELLDKPLMKSKTTAGRQSSSKSPWHYEASNQATPITPAFRRHRSSHLSTLIPSPDSTTERSPSLLPHVRRFSEDHSVNQAKRRKQENEPVMQEENKEGEQEGRDKQQDDIHERIKRAATAVSSQSFKEESVDMKVQLSQTGIPSQRPNVSYASPAFKKPSIREASRDGGGKRRKPPQELNASRDQHGGEHANRKPKVEPMWSIDPAVALSMYDSEWRGDEEKEEEQFHGELADTDCTWVSHSLLQGRGENARDRRDSVSGEGLGERANDSLDMMFDTTAYGEYKSYNTPRLGQSQPCGGDDDDDDDDNEEEEEEQQQEEDDEQDPLESTLSQMKKNRAKHPTFAHVAVIRKKDERRKLKGTTCKECEVYYADLPEEEKQKKLSGCSRHRFLYIPPCTPENFWEVGFPSTQTCIERGYVKEEKNPQARPRRRQPFNALFSPKRKQQES